MARHPDRPAGIFPLKSVDVLVGQNELYLFDKSNKLLKQHKLKYPISEEFASPFGRPAEAPCLEDDGLVFFFDQGTVTAFAAATGELRWTLTTVWTSRVQPDGQGHLFISTTSAGPDSIQYSEQVNLTSRPSAVLMKVEAQTGKVLWSRNDAGQACHLAGKFLYGTRRRGGAALSPFAPSSEVSLTISRLKPRNGKRTWDYPCKPAPDYFEFQDNRILLQNDNEVRVLKYLAIF